MTESHTDDTEKIALQMRQLALVDRIIGLEAQIAAMRANLNSEALTLQIKAVRSSATWRVGRAVLSPYFAVNRMLGRTKKR